MDLRSVRTSLYRFIERRSTDYGLANVRILPGPSGRQVDRPLWEVQSTPGGGITRMAKNFSFTSHRFAAFYLTKDFDQAELMIRYMEREIRNRDYRIPGVLVDYEYPQPIYAIRTGAGSALSTGTIYVSVSGLGYLDDAETLRSEPLAINVQAGDAVDIWIPRVPRVFNWFKKYNVYVGTSTDTMKKITGSPFDAESATTVTTKVTISQVPGTGDAPPTLDITQPSVVKFRFLRIVEAALNYSVIPEPFNEANAYRGVMNMVIESQDIPQYPQGRPIEGVHMSTSVSGDDQDKYQDDF